MSKKNRALSVWPGVLVLAGLILAVGLVTKTALRESSKNSVAKELTNQEQTTIDGNALHPCTGNPQDECKGSPSIDFYPGGSEAATNPEFENQGEMKEIMGRITGIDGKTVSVKSSSGRTFVVQFPIDAVAEFNTSRSPNYQNIKVVVGDMLHIDYSKVSGADEMTIMAKELSRSSLLLTDTNPKVDPTIKKY